MNKRYKDIKNIIIKIIKIRVINWVLGWIIELSDF